MARESPFRITPRRVSAVVVVTALLAIVVIDRVGLLGSVGSDVDRYHNRSFAVVRVIDGDTIEVAAPDRSQSVTRVRLWGVDTPEVHGRTDHFGPEASAFVKALLADSTVRLELLPRGDNRGKLGRLLAYVYLPDGRMLNEVLLESGYGYADLRFEHPRFNRFRHMEQAAEKAGLGLWKGATFRDWPSWRQRELGRDGDLRASSRAFHFQSTLTTVDNPHKL